MTDPAGNARRQQAHEPQHGQDESSDGGPLTTDPEAQLDESPAEPDTEAS
jgi:hypothetical protein